MKPIVAIALDAEQGSETSYSLFPFYALRKNYFDAVTKAGGIPIAIPHNAEAVAAISPIISGVLIPGGAFDIDPSHYGESTVHQSVTTKAERTKSEWLLVEHAIEKKKPILGICGGEQLINVVLGGSLIQHIPDEITAPLPHEVKDRLTPAHTIQIHKDSKLFQIVKTEQLGVNTSHHQAVKNLGKNLQSVAHTIDGVIEAIEHINHPFCIGVQWHPEYEIHEQDTSLFTAFINEAAKVKLRA
jgi:putative glutamine amidotransferase